MSFSSWLRNHFTKRAPRRRARRRPSAARFRPRFEALESRIVPSSGPTILTVNSLADSSNGKGSNLTLRDAISQADKNTNKTYEIDIAVAGMITLESSLPDLANNITIVGLGTGKTVIQRDTVQAPFRIVTVDAGETVALSGLTITEGNAGSGNGGAIDNFGNLTLTSCALSVNSAASGGAVANETGASLTVTGSTFLADAAYFGATTTAGYGGAINNNGTLTISGSTFTGNFATDGGAINNNATVTGISQCTFNNNQATTFSLADYGGAIDNTGTAQVSDSTFTSNESDHFGAGIYNGPGATLVTTGCQFASNKAGDGGAIDSDGNLMVNSDTNLATFAGNTASIDGGAIFSTGKVTVSGASFTDNTAGFEGGAIFNVGTATVSQTGFTDTNTTPGNSAVYGGAIFNSTGANLTVNSGTTFARDTASQDGGAIFNYFGTATVTQSAFYQDQASSGGAIENWTGASLTVNPGTTFTGNMAGFGGAIDSYYGASTLAINGASFSNNTASSYGGAINNHSGATLSGCTFTGNQSLGIAYPNGGGAIWNDGTLTVQGNSSFVDNSASYVGGAIDNFGTATVTQTAFTNSGSTPGNSAQLGGAIMNWTEANLTLNPGTSFTSNIASLYGGAIFSYGTLVAGGASFTSNSALDGGAVITHGDATFTGCSFDVNHSTANANNFDGGGAIWNEGTLNVQGNSSFSGNTAAKFGGAIFNRAFAQFPGVAVVTQSAFSFNSAFDGGAIGNSFGATLTVNAGTSFDGNFTIGKAGGSGVGGAILNEGTMDVSGASFTSNAAFEGGGVANDGAANVLSSTFSGNNTLFGGAIFNFLGCSLTVSGCQITSNSAGSGGGIYNSGGVLNVVSACQIEDNTASSVGGGILTDANGTTNIDDSVVEFNSPDDTHTVPGSHTNNVNNSSNLGVQT
jgi:predicted outer membrane repeat protein